MGWNYWSDEPTTEFTDSELEEHDAEVRAEERKKAEQDFQNGEYWNDYLANVIADARADEKAKVIEEMALTIRKIEADTTHCLFDCPRADELITCTICVLERALEQLKEKKC